VTQWTYCVLRWVPLGHHKDSALKVRWIVQPESAQFGGKACRTGDCRRLAEANFYSTSPDMFLGEEVEARFLPHRLQKYLPLVCFAEPPTTTLARGWDDGARARQVMTKPHDLEA
jgi:hypothetical protein